MMLSCFHCGCVWWGYLFLLLWVVNTEYTHIYIHVCIHTLAYSHFEFLRRSMSLLEVIRRSSWTKAKQQVRLQISLELWDFENPFRQSMPRHIHRVRRNHLCVVFAFWNLSEGHGCGGSWHPQRRHETCWCSGIDGLLLSCWKMSSDCPSNLSLQATGAFCFHLHTSCTDFLNRCRLEFEMQFYWYFLLGRKSCFGTRKFSILCSYFPPMRMTIFLHDGSFEVYGKCLYLQCDNSDLRNTSLSTERLMFCMSLLRANPGLTLAVLG